MPIPKRKLGNSDLEVPVACLGTMTWGRQNTEAEAHEQLDYALAHGLNFIDTAEMYPVPVGAEWQGLTEKYIGTWLASRKCRDKIILATKVTSFMPGWERSYVTANRTDPPGSGDKQPRLDRENIRAALEGSLRRLQTDYIDLYQLHWPNRYVPAFGFRQYRPDQERADVPSIEEQVAAIGELIKEGKIRYWGLSNETTFGVCQFGEACKKLNVPLPITIQNDFAITYRFFEQELAEACAPSNYNISLFAYGALAGGTLSDKYFTEKGFEGAPARARHIMFPEFQARYHTERVLTAARKYYDIAKRNNLTLQQLAYAWAASRWYMGSVIIGATTLEQLKENITAFEIELSPEILAKIEQVHLQHPNPEARD